MGQEKEKEQKQGKEQEQEQEQEQEHLQRFPLGSLHSQLRSMSGAPTTCPDFQTVEVLRW